jgi:P27 family predicted phage terminase small subunit
MPKKRDTRAKSPGRKKREGNPGKRRLPENPKAQAARLRCPAWLPEEAKKQWKRLEPELGRLKIVSVLDLDVLAIHCISLAKYLEAESNLRKTGCIYKTPTGQIKRNPLVAIVDGYRQAVLTTGSKLGLTPLARQQLDIPREIGDELSEFLDAHPTRVPALPGVPATPEDVLQDLLDE